MPKYDLTIGYETDLTKAEDAAITAHRQWTRASYDKALLARLLAEQNIMRNLHRLCGLESSQARQKELNAIGKPEQLPLYESLLRLLAAETADAHTYIRAKEENVPAADIIEVDCG